jgi:tryptophanyl-tRNA synthetase
MHIGHYHGALKNWVKLQEEYECLYFAADWHALTTHFETAEVISETVWEMFIDWLAAGVNPARATIFIQSRVPEHAELALLLGMITPVGWLERVPTYKDQQQKLTEHDLSNFGFLGYPVMQGADILIYRANMVPVGEDQVSHIELVRELARRFNHIYGTEPGFEEKAKAAVKKLGAKKARKYAEYRTAFQERGDAEALETARAMLNDTQNLSLGDRERLFGYLEGSRRVILPEPAPLLTETPKVPGLDGQKMSKSYGNTIDLRDEPDVVVKKLRTMPTDPARVRRTDPGEPEKCPVWSFHQVYSDEPTREWVQTGCRSAGIGCLDCKQKVIDKVLAELAPIQARAHELEQNPEHVRAVVADGSEKARDVATATLDEVRRAMGLAYK